MERLKLGVIGTGLIWEQTHKQILLQLQDRVELAAFSARSEQSGVKLAAEFPKAQIFQDYHKLIAWQGIDAVVILTPIPLNAPVALEALAAGKHVFVEKPMATTVADAERMIALEKTMNKHVYVLEQCRYRSVISAIKNKMTDGSIGEIQSFEYVTHYVIDRAPDHSKDYGNTEWRIAPEFPLGMLFDGGIHQISEMTYLFGLPHTLYATGKSAREGFGAYDHVHAICRFANEVTGYFSHSSYMDSSTNFLNIRGSKGTLAMHGNQLTVQGEPIVLDIENESMVMWQTCLDHLSGHSELPYRATDSLRDIKFLDAITRSLETGGIIHL